MTIVKHELRQGRISLLIWSAIIAFMLGVCVLIYPEMSSDMGELSAMFADMGAFSDAFGMDQINFGEFLGFFGVECGNVLGLGGAFFAALLGISVLSKEEKEHTAEFLLTHPVSRSSVAWQKLLAAVIQIVLLNLAAAAVSALTIAAIGEDVFQKPLFLLFLANFLMQLEIAAITFGISAFLSRGGLGAGLGLAAALYFLNILSNLKEELEILKYLTPFGYTESAAILSEGCLNTGYLAVGLGCAAVFLALGLWKYCRKDIA